MEPCNRCILDSPDDCGIILSFSRGRKLNINLEAAIQEAMNELDRQANHGVSKTADPSETDKSDPVRNEDQSLTQLVDSNDNSTKLHNITLAEKLDKQLRSNKKRKTRNRLDQ